MCGKNSFRDERNQDQRGEHETHTVEEISDVVLRRHALRDESRPPDEGDEEEAAPPTA